MKLRFVSKPSFWIILIFAAGCAYLLFLQGLVTDGVYFSGDSGLRAMLTQSLAAGRWSFDLDLHDPAWVQALWQEGLFPYEPPFVYQLQGKAFITFPFPFSFVTAPFYALFGFRGLYIVPVLATILTWVLYLWLCKKLNYHSGAVVAGLFILIFGSNLSLFSAMYWEHTLSVCLSFAGLALIFPRKSEPRTQLMAAVGSGVFSALAAWFRPEQIFLVIFLSLISLWGWFKATWGQRWKRHFNLGPIPDAVGRLGWVVPAASAVTLLLYGLCNWLIYQNFFGVHAIQVLDEAPSLHRLLLSAENFYFMSIGTYSLFLFFPIALFPLGYLLTTWMKVRELEYDQGWTIWYVFWAAFMVGVSILVPPGAGAKQWGPRFLLLLAPVIVLLFTGQIDRLLRSAAIHNSVLVRRLLFVVVLLAAWGIIQNPIRGREFLINTYGQIQPAAEALRTDAHPVVAISDQYLGQIFQPALSRDVSFLRVADDANLAALSEALFAQQQLQFTYVCYSFECKLFKREEQSKLVERNGTGYILQIRDAREYGKYTILDIQVGRDD